MRGVLIWVEFKILSVFFILPHGITIGVNLLSNYPAKGSLKCMNFLLESIITYRLPLLLSKISVSLEFDDVFRCDCLTLNLVDGGGDDGGGGNGDDNPWYV